MSTAKPDFSDPASVVAAFIHQMHYWEGLAGSLSTSAQARFRPDDGSSMHPDEMPVSDLIKKIPPLIAAIYLTPRDSGISTSYSIPPEYDPAVEKVVRVVSKSKTQVIVETDRKAPYMGGIREYLLKKQGDVWLIDSVTAMIGTKKRKLSF